MSLYQSKNDIPKLIGDINTGNPGFLTKAVREHPFGVLLLDELEKADHDLINIFLTIIDEGYFYDGLGKKVDCKNLIIIATSNAGSDYLFKLINENTNLENQENLQSIMINYLVTNKFFTPEFLNRFDGIIVFQPLTHSVIKKIVQKKIERISEELLKGYQIKIKVSESFIDQLINEGYRSDFGARQMERVIREKLENHLADLILKNKIKRDEIVNID